MNQIIKICPVGQPNLIIIISMLASYHGLYRNLIKVESEQPFSVSGQDNQKRVRTSGFSNQLSSWRAWKEEDPDDPKSFLEGVWEPVGEKEFSHGGN